MHYIIVTGTSRGLGAAIAKQLLQEAAVTLFGVSRSQNNTLPDIAARHGNQYHHLKFDLNRFDDYPDLIDQIFTSINRADMEAIHLVNNAGILAPVKPIQKSAAEDIVKNINVNLIAPMLLTAHFLNRSASLKVDKRIINISSGAGKKPYHGWACYCTAKAGIDMFTQSVALEQQDQTHPARILSLAPGVVDTDMQQYIRNVNEKDFRQRQKFLNLKAQDKLLAPEKVARIIMQLLLKQEFESGQVVDIRDKWLKQ